MNIIKSYNKLSKELRTQFEDFYAEGFDSFARILSLGGERYLTVPFKFGDENYLIKIKKLSVDKDDVDLTKMRFDDIGNERFE